MVLRRRPFSEIRIIRDWSVCYRIGTPGWRRLEQRPCSSLGREQGESEMGSRSGRSELSRPGLFHTQPPMLSDGSRVRP